jgi:hypothetical protein
MHSFEVEVEHNGKIHTATARIEKDMLTVYSVLLGRKSASLSSNNEVLAMLLLQELLNDFERKNNI